MRSGIIVDLARLRGAPKPVVDWFAELVLRDAVQPIQEAVDPQILADCLETGEFWTFGYLLRTSGNL